MSDTLKTEKKYLLDMDLLSFVSHELKTPLSTLKLNVEMLKKHVPKNQKKFIDIMDKEVDWMIQFISDTLDMKKMNDKVNMNLDWQKWNQWIQKIQSSLENVAGLYKGKLKLHFTNKETEVYMDPFYIRQVLLNLVLNAIEHSPENSTVEISWEQTEDKKLKIYVMDQGPGITLDSSNKIFEPFYKEREKTNHFIKGSGLGLTIVKKIIQAHDNNVWVFNRPKNKGATFAFTLNTK